MFKTCKMYPAPQMHPTLQKMHPAFWEMHPEKLKMHPPYRECKNFFHVKTKTDDEKNFIRRPSKFRYQKISSPSLAG